MKHTFRTGEWVELIPLSDLRIKHKKRLYAVANSIVPLDAEGNFDNAAVLSRYGSWKGYEAEFSSVRFAALAALVVSAWSWDVPVPQITWPTPSRSTRFRWSLRTCWRPTSPG